MCGIFIYKSSKQQDAEKMVFQGLKDLEYRGYDSWGLISKNKNDNLKVSKFVGKVSESSFKPEPSEIGLGHTRWATHGQVNKENTHPHLSNSGRFAIVHNGIFESFTEHKVELQKTGYVFKSETDTEVFVNLIEAIGLEKAIRKLDGSNAFALLDTNTDEIYIYKNGSSLYVGQIDKKNSQTIITSSDLNALTKYTNKIYSLKDGELINLSKLEAVNFTHYENLNETQDLQNFPHFTLKEIFDQKRTIKDAYTENKKLSSESILGEKWFEGQNIFASGCGTAYHAAIAFSYLAASEKINVRTIPANEHLVIKNLIDKNTILFLFSQSGETADSILFAKFVQKAGGKVYSVLNAKHSTLAQISNQTFFTHSGKEVAVASTKAFTGMLATCFKILNLKISNIFFQQINNYIEKETVENIQKVATEILKQEKIFILGKGLEYVVAMETALKIKETSYVHAEAFATGELKHGVLALVDEKTTCIIFGENENAALQIKARGGNILGIAAEQKEYHSHFISVPKSEDEKLDFIFHTIAGQILAYQLAVLKNLNPDKPRNLAKSVTVL